MTNFLIDSCHFDSTIDHFIENVLQHQRLNFNFNSNFIFENYRTATIHFQLARIVENPFFSKYHPIFPYNDQFHFVDHSKVLTVRLCSHYRYVRKILLFRWIENHREVVHHVLQLPEFPPAHLMKRREKSNHSIFCSPSEYEIIFQSSPADLIPTNLLN